VGVGNSEALEITMATEAVFLGALGVRWFDLQY
jgi:hypothetical protein